MSFYERALISLSQMTRIRHEGKGEGVSALRAVPHGISGLKPSVYRVGEKFA
jgi:hypothetical protein